jgi:hypothetical protein
MQMPIETHTTNCRRDSNSVKTGAALEQSKCSQVLQDSGDVQTRARVAPR